MERLELVGSMEFCVGSFIFLGDKRGISGISWWDDLSQLNLWNSVLDPLYLVGFWGRKWEFEEFHGGTTGTN